MQVLDLVRRVKNTAGIITTQTLQHWTKRRLTAVSLLVKMIALVVAYALLPAGGLIIEPVQAAEDTSVQPVVETNVPTLVLSTDSVEAMLQLAARSELTITVTESVTEAHTREARVQVAGKYVRVASATSDATTDVPLDVKRQLAKSAAAAYGIDWKLVEAVWQIESGKRWKTNVQSPVGAQGPMQFMPGTWRSYAVDGNGDGSADVTDARDAVYAGAKYLAANGAATNVDAALLHYNHAGWYVTKVKNLAASIQS